MRNDQRVPLSTPRAPLPAAPYSQAIVARGMVYLAGQGGFEPDTGELVDGIKKQTERMLKNIAAVLESGGASLVDLVKVTVYLADLSEFADMNDVYSQMIPEPRPARTTIEAGLSSGMRIEMDAIARLPDEH